PQLDTYYLMSIAVNDTPERIELLARATPLASSRRAPGGVAAQKALVVGGQLDSNQQRTERSVAVALNGDAALRPLLEEPLNRTSSATQAVVALLQVIGTGQEPPGNVRQLAQSAFDSSMDLWRTSLGALDVRLQQRAEDLQQKNSIAMLVAALMLISILYLLIAFYYSMMHAVRTLDQASKQALAGGTVTLDTRDELGEVVTSFNRVVGELARENAERVASERERTELQEAIIATQAAAIEELSVPIIRLGDGVVMLPLLGTIDAARGSQILQTLLNGVSSLRASLVILDLTGIRTIDTFAVRTLLDAMTGARLLGADVALVGVRADVALTITRLGTDMSEFHCHASLQEALQHYMSPEHAHEGVGSRNGRHN
ncbi:MAG TPA: STAS domain-containing protein, partial [Roseiflexaceae bacterium]|nr:STAS domain-containing protein [Roseiflexaceae bacterium]